MKALVLGASGLVGKALVNQLLANADYSEVVCLVRKPLRQQDYRDPHHKLRPIVIEFEQLDDYQGYFTVDHVYCCLGTTIKQAGSKAAFRKVDFEYVHIAAQLARSQGAKGFVWVSSVGANAKSRHFYLRLKGELENAILNMPQLNHAAAVRPSVLIGQRDKLRLGERIGQYGLQLISPLLIGKWQKYRPVNGPTVANWMIQLQPRVNPPHG